ncbi:DNA-3-methyladenine glycosylase I [Macrococcus psychrotolerans]|uniref:DNA-3-methyladenine glycosylase I n=1 Tax=Macrococcus psychrotolerans TaxID=3039389 RepID=A0AAU6RAH5_9STAP
MEIVRMIRNRLKVRSIMSNVQVFMEVREQYGTFDRYIWHFTNGMPVVKFVGPVIIYGYLGAIGIIQDKLK